MAAVLVETLHMVPGDGDTSYARNSIFQSGQQSSLKPMIEEAVGSLLNDNGAVATSYSGGMAIADLGCSCGPNTLVLVSTAVDAVRRRCSELQQQPPELCIHLNDLPSNDFNLVIRSLATYTKFQESFSSSPVLTSIVPGSFHGRLFNKRSLHLVCSTASLHWLSKAPEDLVQNGIPFYDRDEAARRTRRSAVVKAYARQFRDDLTRILHLRAQEMVPGGRFVFSLLGHSDDTPASAIQLLEFINAVLHEMASKGLIDKEKLDSFYIPMYGPSEEEVREIIEAEGSFSIDKMAVIESLHPNSGVVAPKTRAHGLRAVMEPIIAQHFGSSADAMDEFSRIAEKLIKMSPLDEYPSKPSPFVAASLTRRT